MNQTEIEKIVFDILKRIAPDTEPEALKPGDSIREKLGIDSYDFLQFIVALDEQLLIAIPEEDYGKVASIGSLIDYLKARLK